MQSHTETSAPFDPDTPDLNDKNWPLDPAMASLAAGLVPDLENIAGANQYPGDIKPWKEQWTSVLNFVPDQEFCDYRVPAILESARTQQWPLFVLQVGLWGQMIPGPMGRSHRKIYGVRYGEDPGLDPLHRIEKCLGAAWGDLQARQSLEGIWNRIRAELGWSAVMISKCLHFMTRAAGWADPVPVPVDNAMVRQWLWPSFKKAAEANRLWPSPGGINGNSWESYNRYMTAIRCWARAINTSCTELEVTIFARWRLAPKKPLAFIKG